MGIRTALGVSNVSFGLPMRPLLNRTFLAMALAIGLSMPIINALDSEMMGTVHAFRVLSGEDEGAKDYISIYRDAVANASVIASRGGGQQSPAKDLYDCILRGLDKDAAEFARAELAVRAPLDVVEQTLVPALNQVGEEYAQGKLFLPQLIASAQAAKTAFGLVGEKLGKGGVSRGKVVLATVHGDVHDIGKNIVKVVAQSHGYEVIDLGKDVAKERVVEAALREKPLVVGLSALMTTTVKSLAETIAALRQAKVSAKIYVGGAVLNAETAKKIGADGYTSDAPSFVAALDALRG